MVEGFKQFTVDAVRLQLVGNQLKQGLQALSRLGKGLELAEHRFLLHRLPAFQRCGQQGLARGKVPVEAALGDTESARQRFDGKGCDALLGDDVERRMGPVIGR